MMPLDSSSLATLLATDRSLPTVGAVDVALAICDALAETHARGEIHGALSLSAVRLSLSADGPRDVQILGADAARALIGEDGMLRAPEQLEPDETTDARTDVWGVGVILYTMLAGAPPFSADTPSAINLSLVLDEPPSLAGVPDALAELVESCLAKNRELRPRSLALLAQKLAAFGTRSTLGDADSTARRQVVAAPVLRDASSLEVVVDVEPSVRDLTPAPTPKQSTKAAAKAPTPTLPPVVMPTLAPAPARRSWHGPALVLAVAAVAVGIGVGLRSSKSAPSATAAAAPVHAAAPDEVTGAAVPLAPTPTAPRPAQAADVGPDTGPALPASALPAARPEPRASTVSHRTPNAKSPAAKSSHERSRAGAAKTLAAADPAPQAEPDAARRAEPRLDPKPESKPEPKAADDDLRRFLDDRR
jgi:serine/threonine-protein kinase